jgi:hypothetical protein
MRRIFLWCTAVVLERKIEYLRIVALLECGYVCEYIYGYTGIPRYHRIPALFISYIKFEGNMLKLYFRDYILVLVLIDI